MRPPESIPEFNIFRLSKSYKYNLIFNQKSAHLIGYHFGSGGGRGVFISEHILGEHVHSPGFLLRNRSLLYNTRNSQTSLR